MEAGLSPKSEKTVRRDLKLLMLPGQTKKKITKGSLTEIKKAAMKNKNRQQSPDGKGWAARQSEVFNRKGKPKKMLQKIYGFASQEANGLKGRIFYKNPVSGRIAEEHHFGLTPQRPKQQAGGGKCTVEQAETLIKLGFNAKIKSVFGGQGKYWWDKADILLWARLRTKAGGGKAGVFVTAAGICRALSRQEAGLLIRKLAEKQGKKRQRGKGLPARPAFDFNETNNAKIVEKQIEKHLP